jgi:hypothetical protein
VNESFDPGDPSRSGPGPREISDAAQQARERLREEFEQLRVEIEELGDGESGADDPRFSGGFWGRARTSVAVLALGAAIAAAAGNFALNGGRTLKDGSVSVSPPSNEPEPGVVASGRGGAEPPSSLLSLIGPGLQTGILGSNAIPPSAAPPVTGPAPLFVVGDPVPASGHGSRGGDVGGADPVRQSPTPTPTPPAPEPDTPPLALSPPPPPAGGAGGGQGSGEVPGDDGKPGGGGNTAATLGEDPGDAGGEGEGPPAKGHVKAQGKGHGGSSGKGHEKDQDAGEVADSGPDDDNGNSGHGPKGPGRGGSRGGGPPTATPPPPGPPPPGPDGNPGKGVGPDPGHGKGTAPGQSGK